jgi:diaminopimelate decarboxylase
MKHLLDKHVELLKKIRDELDSSFFFYDLDYLNEKLRNLRSSLDPKIKLWYACKANPLSPILALFNQHNIGIDVASRGELDQAKNSGVDVSQMISTGPSKSRKYLGELIDMNIHTVILESPNQLKWLNEQAEIKNHKQKCLLRVQLDWKEGASVLGGNEITPFGEDCESWKALDLSHYKNLDILGIHVFQWGNILDLSQLENIWKSIAEQATVLASELGIDLRVLDLGGGLGIPYHGDTDNDAIKPEDFNNSLNKIIEKFDINEIWMELGRYAVGDCAVYASQVIDKKVVRGQNQIILDGGMNHLARPALTNQSFPCFILDRLRDTNCLDYNMYGPLCTALDKFGSYKLPAETSEGDWAVFTQTGAYGFTESMPFFLCHNLPAEYTYKQGKVKKIRSVEKPSSWLV